MTTKKDNIIAAIVVVAASALVLWMLSFYDRPDVSTMSGSLTQVQQTQPEAEHLGTILGSDNCIISFHIDNKLNAHVKDIDCGPEGFPIKAQNLNMEEQARVLYPDYDNKMDSLIGKNSQAIQD